MERIGPALFGQPLYLTATAAVTKIISVVPSAAHTELFIDHLRTPGRAATPAERSGDTQVSVEVHWTTAATRLAKFDVQGPFDEPRPST